MSEPVNRFTKIGSDGESLPESATEWEAVLDNTTGLMWTVAEQPVENHAEATTAAQAMLASGHSDWRMPTVEELFLLADRERKSPAIDTDFFPDCKSDWYWTSTPAAPSPGDCAWVVNFNNGNSVWGDHFYGGFVRAVRGGQ